MGRYKRELNYLIQIIENAVKITEWFKDKDYLTYHKIDNSPVTIADLASQIYLISQIKKQFNSDQIIAEEQELRLPKEKFKMILEECYRSLDLNIKENFLNLLRYRGKEGERKWIIDPIDGTKGYQKNEYYAIGVAFLIDYEPKASSIVVPSYNNYGTAIFKAEKGFGAQASYGKEKFTDIKVSSTKNLNNAILCRSVHHDLPITKEFGRMGNIKQSMALDSMAKFCMIADGTYDIYLRPGQPKDNKIWDYCPGDLIVQEAGGKVADFNGFKLKYKNQEVLFTKLGLLVSNKYLFNKALEIIDKIL